MTGKVKLYIGLLVLGLVLVGGGSWGLLNSPSKIEIPEGTPVIAMELSFAMRGEFDKLYLYDDGGVLYVKEKNLRMPTPEYPPTRVWNKGQIRAEELNDILRLFQTDEFAGMSDYYQFSGKPIDPIPGVPPGGFTMGDGGFKFSINYGDLQKTVTAFGYLTLDHGITYPDMPYPLNETYEKLKQIIENKTKEVYSEPIQSSESVETDDNNIPENVDNSEEITANRVHIENGEYILFSGDSKLPEGTYLQHQLYLNGQPEGWWPSDQYVEVRKEKWQINVPLGVNGAPGALSVGPKYVLKVWQKDNPSVMATFPFDLIPPPSK